MGLWALFWRHWCVRCASFEPAKHTVATAVFDLMLLHRLGLAASNVDLWGGWHRSVQRAAGCSRSEGRAGEGQVRKCVRNGARGIPIVKWVEANVLLAW